MLSSSTAGELLQTSFHIYVLLLKHLQFAYNRHSSSYAIWTSPGLNFALSCCHLLSSCSPSLEPKQSEKSHPCAAGCVDADAVKLSRCWNTVRQQPISPNMCRNYSVFPCPRKHQVTCATTQVTRRSGCTRWPSWKASTSIHIPNPQKSSYIKLQRPQPSSFRCWRLPEPFASPGLTRTFSRCKATSKAVWKQEPKKIYIAARVIYCGRIFLKLCLCKRSKRNSK